MQFIIQNQRSRPKIDIMDKNSPFLGLQEGVKVLKEMKNSSKICIIKIEIVQLFHQIKDKRCFLRDHPRIRTSEFLNNNNLEKISVCARSESRSRSSRCRDLHENRILSDSARKDRLDWRTCREPKILNKDFQTLARASLLLSALAISLHYHGNRLATGLGRHRSYRRHRQPELVPELATAAAKRSGPVAADAAAVLPTQDCQSIKRDHVDVRMIASRSLRDRHRRARQALQRDDNLLHRQRWQLLQRRPDARVRPDVA